MTTNIYDVTLFLMNIENILFNIPIFKKLNSNHIKTLATHCRIKIIKKNEILFYEFDVADTVYIIIRGKVKVYKLSEEGNEHILHIHKDKDIIAEAAIFDTGMYPAYCVATEETKLVYISKNSLIDFIRENPEVTFKLLASYSKRLRYFVDKIEYLSLKNVEERIFTYFIKNSTTINNKNIFKLEISKKELALFLGTTPETISRNIKKLVNSKHIELTKPNEYILKKYNNS